MLQVSKECIDYMEKSLFSAGLTVVPLSVYDPSFEELKEHHLSGSAFVFDGGECENTVFRGNRRAQYVYRAWHDTLHIAINRGFTENDEYRIAIEIASVLKRAGFEKDGELLCIDLMLHISYFYTHNDHPKNQLAMISDFRNEMFSVVDVPRLYS